MDHASGVKASRPELDKALASANRDGDQLVINRLDRLESSGLHLVMLGAEHHTRGVPNHPSLW
ncbi:recombinase family protein [Arthrobacter alpinus]|uniref:recombinase family protein n=1 Tax=Arthrobacter alpinus TaxID=656366 RepID=UPI003CC7A05C